MPINAIGRYPVNTVEPQSHDPRYPPQPPAPVSPATPRTCEQKNIACRQRCEDEGNEETYDKCVRRCQGAYEGCKSLEGGPCKNNTECPPGFVCESGRCTPLIGGTCSGDADCPSGQRCKNGRCYVPSGGGGGGNDGGGGGGSASGWGGEQFGWSPEIQALLARILDRANSLLDQPLGLSDEERQAIYNRIFEKIKGTEAPTIQSMLNRTSRQGLLGSPYAERAVAGIQRGTGEQLAGAERDIEIQEAQDRYQQLLGTTGMAQSLLGTGMGAEQLVEAANAARRGEGTTALNLMLQYLSSMMGGQNNSYWQAILAQLGR